MKYIDVKSVVESYKGFQDCMTNKSWGYLALLKGCNDIIRPLIPYEVNMDIVSNFLEGIFNLTQTKRRYDGGRSLYVVFSNKWDHYFNDQGRYSPNIYDVAVWAYRRKGFPDDITEENVINEFSKEFNIPFSIIKDSFNTLQKKISFTNALYSESTLKSELVRIGVDVSRNNIDAKKGGVVASPGEISRGPFVQTLYAGLDITDYVLILQSNYNLLYGGEKQSVDSPQCDTPNPLQQIYYGAPGTGKSHEIKKLTKGKEVIRTTFHPDSDYSTFVGAYKPTTKKVPIYSTYGEKAVEVKDADGNPMTEDRIVYEFVEQAFLQAYIKAWKQFAKADEDKAAEEVYLVIEEINRGNCAQIFGDLFQLLDRGEDGFSEYPIVADKDLQKQLAKAFADMPFLNAPAVCVMSAEETAVKIRKGEILLLPNNLYIWATMNTSDQSLFPIDSAFKRRWDWKYIPIADAKKNYVIEVDGDQYDWWSFLDTINDIIEYSNQSEDKKLGYFFAKAKDGIISADTFVSKVIFYLWNDVFKDNESGHKAFQDENGGMLAFRKFFHNDGSINTDMVIKFLQDLEVEPFENTAADATQQDGITPSAKRKYDHSSYRVNNKDNLNKAQMTREAFRLYIDAHSDKDANEIAQAWNGLGLKGVVQHLVETEEEFIERTKDSKDTNKRAVEFMLANEEKIYLSTQFGIDNIGKFIEAVNNAGWNIRIDKIADKT